MDLGLDGRTALVAGGSSGLGFAIAHELAANGARVAIGARDEQRLSEAADELRASGADTLLATSVDVRDDAAVRSWVDEVVSAFGQLDIVLANAGGPPRGVATEHDVDAYRDAVELNLVSSIGLVLAALPHVRASDQGRILFLTSLTVKQPIPTLALSNTARPGVLGFARSLVDDLADTGVTVNVLAPGLIRTRRLEELRDEVDDLAAGVPLGRIGDPEEFAAAATFLASAGASYITGVVLPVDGGAYRGLS